MPIIPIAFTILADVLMTYSTQMTDAQRKGTISIIATTLPCYILMSILARRDHKTLSKYYGGTICLTTVLIMGYFLIAQNQYNQTANYPGNFTYTTSHFPDFSPCGILLLALPAISLLVFSFVCIAICLRPHYKK